MREKSARCIITSWKDILQLRWTLDNSIFELIPLNTNDQHSHHKQNKLDERVHNWQVTQRKTRASESGDEGGRNVNGNERINTTILHSVIRNV